jgi:signal transduction histidine kinase
LRSPLHVLSGYLGILAEDWGAEFSGEPLRILERLRVSTAELTETVENLLEYATAVTGTQAAVQETFEVADLIAELDQRFAAAAQRKKLSLVWKVQPQLRLVHSDRRRLVSIINNLVSNAIKFTERGGVTVLLRCLRVKHKCLMELEVTDTGIGIDKGRLEDAFAPFVQLSSSNSRDHRGLGLGLALVRRNLIALAATLEVESKPSIGSRLRVRFPGGLQA